MAESTAREVHVHAPQAKGGSAASPFILPYASILPDFAGPPEAAERAAVLGRATIGRNAKLGASSVIRADGHFVRVGDDFFLGHRGTVHIAHDVYPTIIGDRVTVGTNAVVHACTVGSDVTVGDNAVILDGSVVGDNIVIEAGSIVFPRSQLAGGKLYAGMPARPVRDLRAGEIEKLALRMRRPATAPGKDAASAVSGSIHDSVLVAGTARLAGRIDAAENSSIWFGCDFDANGGAIEIGLNTNIQDNTWIHCRAGRRFEIGPDSTIGHNVTLGDCTIGARSLIGIGAVVANGTIVEDDVFLAAGAETAEGQVLEGGYLWGKRPAVKMAPLDQAKRDLIKVTIEHYCGYARAFAAAQRS
jgi:carbonic anhydrase/acetyltransferase-like protein (isoleucine patch superfamily)